MKLLNYFYECKNCGTGFKSPELGGNRYGDFLMRNETGKIVYLNSFDTPVFDEFSKIFHQNIQIINRDISDIEKSDIFQKIFSVACDLAPDNTPYEIARDPACPSCVGFYGDYDSCPINPLFVFWPFIRRFANNFISIYTCYDR